MTIVHYKAEQQKFVKPNFKSFAKNTIRTHVLYKIRTEIVFKEKETFCTNDSFIEVL